MALWQARLLGFCFLLATYGQAQTPMHLPDMPLHDPWILANAADRTYYLYTSNVPRLTGVNERGTWSRSSSSRRLMSAKLLRSMLL